MSKDIPKNKVKTRTIIYCFIGALGGLLFGLDQGFINGSFEFIVNDWHLTLSQGESYAGIMLIGAAVGIIISGWFARTAGRRNTLIIAGAVFTVFAILGSITQTYFIFYWTRFFIGLAVGSASFVVPLYLSEIAPTKIRGSMISLYQLYVTIGICGIYCSNAYIGHHYQSWRPMLGIIALPAALMFVLSFFIPRTPRWLLLKGKQESALKILNKTLSSPEEVEKELKEINQSLGQDKKLETTSALSMMKKGFFIKAVFLGIALMAIQQLTGINGIIYYSGIIFKKAGISNPGTGTILIGIVNVIFTLLGVKLIDRFGRKPLLYAGITIITLTLIVMGTMFALEDMGTVGHMIMLVSCLLYIIGAAFSIGPIAWVLCAEIFPLECRDIGITITTLSNIFFVFIIVRYSLTLMNMLGGSGMFFVYAGISVLSFLVVKFFVPETRGISLEKIELDLKNGVKLRNLGTKH